MRPFAALAVAAALASGGAASAQMTAEGFARAVAENGKVRDDGLVRAGLLPASDLARQGRTIRRFHLSVWLPSNIPVVELERSIDGRTTMRLYQAQRPVQEELAPPELWETLAKLDAAIYAPPVFAHERERLARPVTWSSCHGDGVTFQRIEAGRVSVAGGNRCANSVTRIDDAMAAAIRLYARALLDVRGCTDPLGPAPADVVARCYQRP